MTLSDEDRRRIEEEEYRKLARERLERERLERTVRAEADIPTSVFFGKWQGAAENRAREEKRTEQFLAKWFWNIVIGFSVVALISCLWSVGVLLFGHETGYELDVRVQNLENSLACIVFCVLPFSLAWWICKKL
jgi:hypothetical protein